MKLAVGRFDRTENLWAWSGPFWSMGRFGRFPFCRVGVSGVNTEHNSQLAHDDCRRIRSTIWKLGKQIT